MNKARVARIARLTNLREQQRRLREQAHAQAEEQLVLARQRRGQCADDCGELDRNHNEFVDHEQHPADLDLLAQARMLAGRRLQEATAEESEATASVDMTREELLAAHRAHRSFELYHDRLRAARRREIDRADQKECDDLSQRIGNRRRR